MEPESRFREIFNATYSSVVRYGRHRGLSGQDLEDLVAATFEVAWRRLDRVPAGDEALPWLLAVARNHLRNHRRRLARDRALLEQLPAPEHAHLRLAEQAGWREIRAALDALSPADRDLVLLVAWDELTPAQAAAVLGISPGAARTRLHRARARLAQTLGRGGEPKPAALAPSAQGPAIRKASP